MGSFVVYVLEWAMCLSAFLLLYKMCFSGSTFHRFNRLFLLGSVVVSALLPLIHVTANEQMEPIAEVCRLSATQLEPLTVASPLQMSVVHEQLTVGQRVFVVLAITYLIYIAIQVIGWLKSLVKMMLFLRGKRSRKVGRWIRLVVHGEEYGPFSWMNCIVISDQENGFGRRASIHHELSHIRLLHPVDLVFILLCTLVNPVCWLVMKEIKVVHEYEADDEVINHYRIRSRDYQRLLIQRTVGAEAYALACSFNLNIKKRIIMMKKKQSTWWRTAWIAVTLPLISFSLMAFSKPKEALKEAVDNSVKAVEQPLAQLVPDGLPIGTPDPPKPAIVEEPQQKASEVKPGSWITGTVKDENGQSLQYANVFEEDEYHRVVARALTDKNGKFLYKVINPKNKLRVTYVGFKSKTLDISGSEMDVKLEPATTINNIQVVGRRDSVDLNSPRYNDQTKAIEEGRVFELVEQAPSYPGGMSEIMKYLSTHLRYPAVAREVQVEAEITVKFVVDKTGFVRLPKVASVNTNLPADVLDLSKIADDDEEAIERTKAYLDAIEALKEEAVYVVRNMPRWEPGRQNGKRVETTYTVPVSFNLAK